MGPIRRILLLDDCATIRAILRVYLMNLGAEIVEAADASTALAILRHRSVDLVIADVRMEPVDGIAFVGEIRRDESAGIRSLPVILLTSDRDETLKERGLAAGASAFVHKPVSPLALMKAIESLGLAA